jgi:hypothetical protein
MPDLRFNDVLLDPTNLTVGRGSVQLAQSQSLSGSRAALRCGPNPRVHSTIAPFALASMPNCRPACTGGTYSMLS